MFCFDKQSHVATIQSECGNLAEVNKTTCSDWSTPKKLHSPPLAIILLKENNRGSMHGWKSLVI
jgi:hypothetical protein